MNYYNEFDPYAAQWLRNLIDAGHLPKGEVDSRSIKDVKASDIIGFVQCHFFAGLGGWSHALRLAEWPEDRPVWTGSCPCQPFSAAGAGGGVTDERHLWPVWFNLIRECRPDVIFGEQVEAAINHGWLDLVQSDLEGEGYACGAVGLPAGGVGAPHIRHRLWFVADATSKRGDKRFELESYGRANEAKQDGLGGKFSQLADSENANGRRHAAGQDKCNGDQRKRHQEERQLEQRSATGGFWSDCDWLPCRDGKARPVEPGTFPLAHGSTARVGRLRAYGNAIVPQVAQTFIEAYLES
jgi:DNA (cytosine-5)-methyltransferase 1